MPHHLTIPRGPITLAADLHVPEGFGSGQRHPTVVLSTPGSSVKEQIGANYASRLAARGFSPRREQSECVISIGPNNKNELG